MSNIEKHYEELTFTDDFIFWKVMSTNLDLCKELLELILDKKIVKIESGSAQKTIEESSDAKGIRLDVFMEGENEVYSIEMQTTKNRDLPKRVRYYQGMICLDLLEKGEIYEKLKASYVIFICTFDPFGKGLEKYTFENRCLEIPDLKMGDEAVNIFVNGSAEQITGKMGEFISFLSGKVTGDFSERLQQAVEEAKKNAEWRHEYMTLYMRDMENRAIGEKIGEKKGENRLAELITKLISAGRSEDVTLASSDEEARKRFYKEFGIID